jgi:Fe-S-cluster containining protein
MTLDQRLNALDQICGLYNDVAKNLDAVCKKHCAVCCTANVTMTTLEGYLIADHMISNGQTDVFKTVQAKISENRFKPKTTTNRLADLCMKGEDPPEEGKEHSNKSCPVLKHNLCAIYGARPFGCRCFMSKHDCGKAGYAEVDPFVVTLNTLFMQFIEHIDFMGFSGNFADVLLLMISEENQNNYKMNALRHPGAGFVSNIKINVLMIPHEHRMTVKPVLDELLNILRLL